MHVRFAAAMLFVRRKGVNEAVTKSPLVTCRQLENANYPPWEPASQRSFFRVPVQGPGFAALGVTESMGGRVSSGLRALVLLLLLPAALGQLLPLEESLSVSHERYLTN